MHYFVIAAEKRHPQCSLDGVRSIVMLAFPILQRRQNFSSSRIRTEETLARAGEMDRGVPDSDGSLEQLRTDLQGMQASETTIMISYILN